MSLAQVRDEQIIYGLSSDTKPSARGNDAWIFRETDTGSEYIWDGDSWVLNLGASSSEGGSTSSGNSSTDLLASGATFTGTWETNALDSVMVSVTTDTTGTLYFDFSNDGGTTSSTFPVAGFAVASGIHEFHTALKGPRSFRVPSNKKMRIKQVYIDASRANGAAGSSTVIMRVRPTGGVWSTRRTYHVTTNAPVNIIEGGLVLDPLTAVQLRITSVSDTDTNFTGQLLYERLDT